MNNLKINEDFDLDKSDKYIIEDKNMYKIDEDILNSELMENSSEETIYNCSSCRMQVDIINGDKGYCEQCESIVFIERA
jgi:DNA-directed RNA polymerase subunit RPC12/RpoP